MNAQSPAPFDWSALPYLLALARERRLLRAAKSMRVEHTTVARRISALETSLGVPLFYRTAQGYLLTPAGARIVEASEGAEQAALRVWSAARESSGRLEGKVRIAIIESFVTYWLAGLLGELSRRYPGISLDIMTGNAQLNLSRGEAELAVRTPRPTQRALTAYRLARSSFRLWATPEVARRYAAAFEEAATPAQIRGVPLLVYGHELQVLQAAKWFEPVRQYGEIRVVSNSSHALVAAARAGHGVAVLASFIGRQESSLVRVTDRPVSQHEAWLVSHPEFRRHPCVDAVARVLKAGAAGLRD